MWTLFLGILLGLAIPPFYKWVVALVTKPKSKPMAFASSMDSDEKTLWTMSRAVIGLAVVLFTYFGFFSNQPCDLDNIYLSCRLNPFTTGDLVGTILFYAGCFFLAGVPDILGLKLFNPRGSAMWNIIFGLGAVAGVVLIWNT